MPPFFTALPLKIKAIRTTCLRGKTAIEKPLSQTSGGLSRLHQGLKKV